MIVNLAALAFTVALAVAGVWLAIQIADMRKNQDCLLSGMGSAPREHTIGRH
jgi:hypothetical protein